MADLADHLIALAWELDKQKEKGDALREVRIRRSVSTAYYAVFHALLHVLTDQIVGPAPPLDDSYVKIYRFFDHSRLLKCLLSVRDSEATKDIAATFKTLQELRQTADYDPRPFPIGDAELDTLTDDVFWTVTKIRALDPQQRVTIIAALLDKHR
jgi:hypothetical protein